jgi:hypothetical protein
VVPASSTNPLAVHRHACSGVIILALVPRGHDLFGRDNWRSSWHPADRVRRSRAITPQMMFRGLTSIRGSLVLVNQREHIHAGRPIRKNSQASRGDS